MHFLFSALALHYLCSPTTGQTGFDSGSEWYVSTQCA